MWNIDALGEIYEFVSETARFTGIAPNKLSTVNFLEALSLVSTIASTSADATSAAANEVNS